MLSTRQQASKRAKQKIGLIDLPVELILSITTEMKSDVDLLCLALTCKSMLNIIDPSGQLQSQFRQSTRTMPHEFYDRYTVSEKLASGRWKLLGHLETFRWRLCYGCQRLHPPSEFSLIDLMTPAWRRHCKFGDYTGVARICPCAEITFRDKRKITAELQKIQKNRQHSCGGEPEHQGGRRPQPRNQYTSLPSGFDPVTGQHECIQVYDDHHRSASRIKARRIVKFVLQRDNKSGKDKLVLETQWKVTETRSESPTSKNIILLCPHTQMVPSLYHADPRSMRQSNPETIDGELRWVKFVQGYFSCPWCTLTIHNVSLSWAPGMMYTRRHFSFVTRRSLGTAIRRADINWYLQTETSIEYLPADSRTNVPLWYLRSLIYHSNPS